MGPVRSVCLAIAALGLVAAEPASASDADGTTDGDIVGYYAKDD